jgi:hypothetical protein
MGFIPVKTGSTWSSTVESRIAWVIKKKGGITSIEASERAINQRGELFLSLHLFYSILGEEQADGIVEEADNRPKTPEAGNNDPFTGVRHSGPVI